LVALLGVALKPVPPGLLPRFQFVGNAVEFRGEGQFGRVWIGARWWGAGTLAFGGVGEPAEGMQKGGGSIPIFEDPDNAHGARTIRANKRVGFPDFLDEFAPFLAGDSGEGIPGKFDDFDVGSGRTIGRWNISIGMCFPGQSLVECFGALLMLVSFAFGSEIGVGATVRERCVGSTRRRGISEKP
jgi:hypothetical protein